MSFDPIVSGVYILFTEMRAVYVGKSLNIHKRIQEHRTGSRPFEFAAIIQCQPTDMTWMEAELIRRIRPEQNTQGLSGIQDTHPLSQVQAHIIERTVYLTAPAPDPYATLTVMQAKDLCGDGLGPRMLAAVADGAIPVAQVGNKRIMTRHDLDMWRAAQLKELGLNPGIMRVQQDVKMIARG